MGSTQFNVYKLDKEKVLVAKYVHRSAPTEESIDIDSLPTETYIDAIIDEHNFEIENGESSSRRYVPAQTGHIQSIDDTTFYIYHSVLEGAGHHWNRLFPTSPSLEDTVFENAAAFYIVDDEIFVITSGHSIGLFERYIDDGFPVEVAQRIMKPEPNKANERVISGNIYGRSQIFRRNQPISAARSINSVWQSLGGQLADEIISNASFSDIFPRYSRQVNAEFSGSVLIKKALPIDNLPRYTKWLLAKSDTPLTTEQETGFRYLRSLGRLNKRRNKDLIRRLDVAYTKYLLDITDEAHEYAIDFAHTDYARFALSQNFELKIDDHVESFDYEDIFSENPAKFVTGKLHQIVSSIIEDTDIDDEGIHDLIKNHTRIKTETGDTMQNLDAPLLSFFHGEFDFEDGKYFRIDGQWYEASADFLSTVRDEFSNLLAGSFIVEPSDLNILLNPAGNTTENSYNRLYAARPNYLLADKVEIEGIELADVIKFTTDGIEIHHNKIGFGASMRDVRSQLALSMSLIDRVLDAKDTGRKILAAYYDILKKKYDTGEYRHLSLNISKDEFVEKMTSTPAENYTFVLGCLDDKPITSARKSSIAKYELIGLCKVDIQNYGFALKVVRIGREEDNE